MRELVLFFGGLVFYFLVTVAVILLIRIRIHRAILERLRTHHLADWKALNEVSSGSPRIHWPLRSYLRVEMARFKDPEINHLLWAERQWSVLWSATFLVPLLVFLWRHK